MLRYKVRCGDDDTLVFSDCLSALLHLSPTPSLPFVCELLDAVDPTRWEAAALSLGGSRLEAALPVLQRWWQRSIGTEKQRTALIAIAMLRLEPALEFLLAVVREQPAQLARDSITALAIHKYDERLRQRVLAAVEQRGDGEALRLAVGEAFGCEL